MGGVGVGVGGGANMHDFRLLNKPGSSNPSCQAYTAPE